MTTYTAFRMIAYHVPTAHPLPAGGECTISDKSSEAIKEYVADMSKDVLMRLKRLISILEDLAETNFAPEGLLTIFIVPEFYFRPESETQMGTEKTRTYSDKEMFAVLGALRSVFVLEAGWRDWLLILGSIIWRADASAILIEAATSLKIDAEKLAKSDDETDQKSAELKAEQSGKLDEAAQSKDTDGKFIVFNTGIVVTGGYGMTVFDKFHYSDFDAINKSFRPSEPNSAYSQVLYKWRAPLSKYLMERRKLTSQSSIIPIGDKMQFGIEICLDHSLGVLRQQIEKKNPRPELHFQILTCCGMPIAPASVMVGKDGFVLRMDGSPIVEDSDPHSEIQRVTDVKNNITTLATQTNAKNLWQTDNQRRIIIDLAGNQKLDLSGVSYDLFNNDTQQTVKTNLKDVWKQQIVIYKDIRFPAFNLWQD